MLVMIAGCASRRGAGYPHADWSRMSRSERLDSLMAMRPEWREMSFSGKATISSGEKHSASVRVYMVRDSLVHVSLRAYGMEGGIIRATRDSVFFCDKQNGIIASTSLRSVMGDTGVGLSDLQEIICGYYIAGNSIAEGPLLNNKTNFPVKLKFAAPGSRSTVTYDRWERTLRGFLPTRVTGEIAPESGRGCKLSLRLSAGSVKYDQDRVPRWRVAENTRPVDFKQLLDYMIEQ